MFAEGIMQFIFLYSRKTTRNIILFSRFSSILLAHRILYPSAVSSVRCRMDAGDNEKMFRMHKKKK